MFVHSKEHYTQTFKLTVCSQVWGYRLVRVSLGFREWCFICQSGDHKSNPVRNVFSSVFVCSNESCSREANQPQQSAGFTSNALNQLTALLQTISPSTVWGQHAATVYSTVAAPSWSLYGFGKFTLQHQPNVSKSVKDKNTASYFHVLSCLFVWYI